MKVLKDACDHKKKDCINSRESIGGRVRRYKCRKCGHRWSTMEVILDEIRHGQTAYDSLRGQLCITREQYEAIGKLLEAFNT